MISRRLLGFLFLLTFSIVLAQAAQAQAAELTVTVSTDKPEYQSGELVTITVWVLYNGLPVAAKIDLAYIDITYDSGSTFRHYITWDFVSVAPGVFVAQAKAGPAGLRQVYVAARATVTEGCCRITVCGSGVAYFSVRPGCVCQPYYCYQPCYPCWWYQPCPPCPPQECRPPDFFIKHFVHTPSPGEVRRISFQMPDYILDQLLARAGGKVTFREAPPHSVIWSDIPGLGWTNDPLAELGLVLDPETGRISGQLRGELIRKGNYFFFIEALNEAGEVIAGIWIEIAFV